MTDSKYMRPGLGFATGKLVEELGELQAAIGKTMRWGRESFNPELPVEQQETNANWIEREIDDVLGAIENYRQEAGTARTAATIPPAWRLIESAPRDGTRILATGFDWGRPTNPRHFAVVFWEPDQCQFLNFYDHDSTFTHLTHWMPFSVEPEPYSTTILDTDREMESQHD